MTARFEPPDSGPSLALLLSGAALLLALGLNELLCRRLDLPKEAGEGGVKRYLPVTIVVAGLVVGLALLLLALDIARAERELARDDARFLAQPRVPGYWDASGVLPFDLGRRMLGVRRRRERRRAVQRFWRTQPRDTTPPTPARLAARAQAQAALAAARGREAGRARPRRRPCSACSRC